MGTPPQEPHVPLLVNGGSEQVHWAATLCTAGWPKALFPFMRRACLKLPLSPRLCSV